MEVLVTGAAGLLGSNVVTRAFDAGHHVTGTYHTTVPELPVPTRRLDIRDTDAFRSIAEELVPDMVVNCAAMTDVDDCEASPDRAEAINGRAPGELAATCAAAGITFVHVSSDYVFDGESESKYAEAAEPNPIQAYGRSKLLGEKRVRENHPTPLVVRPSFVYGIHGASGELQGFPAWVVSRLGGGEDAPLFVDQRVTPSRAGQAAKSILELVAAGADGTYHVASRDCISLRSSSGKQSADRSGPTSRCSPSQRWTTSRARRPGRPTRVSTSPASRSGSAVHSRAWRPTWTPSGTP